MANRIMLNETSYHGAGAVNEIATEVKARGFRKALVCTGPHLLKYGTTAKVTDVLDAAMMSGAEATDVLEPSMMAGSEATDVLDPSMIANPVQERQHVSTPEQEGTMVLDPNMLQHSNSTFEIERSIILIHTEKVI